MKRMRPKMKCVQPTLWRRYLKIHYGLRVCALNSNSRVSSVLLSFSVCEYEKNKTQTAVMM